MNKYILFFCILYLISCGPKEPSETCSLDEVDGESYVGMVMLCNAMPGQQQDFKGEALMHVSDSLLTFQIESIDSNFTFSHILTVREECIEPENNIKIHILYSIPDNNQLGEIGLNGHSLSLRLFVPPCNENASFFGLFE